MRVSSVERFVMASMVAVVIVGAACATATQAMRRDGRLPNGTWGGEHASLTVTDAGGHFEFDCASGDISKPLVVDDQGRFGMEGVFLQEHPGPVRIGEQPQPQPSAARYAGHLDAKTLTFNVTVPPATSPLGPFVVTLDAPPRVRKCR